MDFELECRCGERLRVEATDAGGTKRCRCGEVNRVPSLSQLRRAAGQQSYTVSIADKLRYMFADGELPPERRCAGCGCETAEVLRCVVECERPYVKGRSFWSSVALGLLAPLWIIGLLSREHQESEVHGAELLVHAPLPLCTSCAATTTDAKQLREWLLQVPLYHELLQAYPHAEPHRLP